MWKKNTQIMISISVIILISLQSVNASSNEEKMNIAASLPDFISIVRSIGGKYVNAYYIMPPGMDPHSFSLDSATISRIEKADLIVFANSELLSYEAKIKANYNKPYLDFSDYAKRGATLDNFTDFNENPHGYWLKVENAIAIAEAVRDKLDCMMPYHKQYFDLSFEIFRSNLIKAKESAVSSIKGNGLYGRKAVAAVPGVCYIAENLGVEIGAILLTEGNAGVSEKRISYIEKMMRNDSFCCIIVPEIMKYAKAGEIARNIAQDTGGSVVYVKFLSGENSTWLNNFYYNMAAFLSFSSTKTKKIYSYELIIICVAISILAAFESVIIYELYRRR